MAWAKNGTSNTLSGTSDDCDITDLTAKKFNQILFHKIPSGNARAYTTFNDDNGTNYAERYSLNGGTDGTLTSSSKFVSVGYYYPANTSFGVAYFINIATKEKLLISFLIDDNGSGSSISPIRVQLVGKWTNTSNQVTRIDQNNDHTGDYTTGTNLTALGTD